MSEGKFKVYNVNDANSAVVSYNYSADDIQLGSLSIKKFIEQQKSDEALLEALRRDYFYQHFYEWINL